VGQGGGFRRPGEEAGTMKCVERVLLGALLAGVVVSGCHGGEGGVRQEREGLSVLTQRDRLYDVQFVGDQVYVVGFPGIILRSEDRGETFAVQGGGQEEALYAVDFVDDKRGFIVGGDGLLLSTTDGGGSWVRVSTGVKEPLFDLDFIDEREGWLVGNFGMILHTADGGRTFERQTVKGEDGEEEEEEGEEEGFDRLLNGVSFLDGLRGWIVGESGTILETRDGGKTWEARDSGEWAPLYSVLFVDSGHGFVAGSEGALLWTGDGGESWERVETGTSEHLFRLGRGGDVVYAVGRRGVMLAVALGKGGEGEVVPGEVRRVDLGVYQWLSSVGFGAEGRGVVVGGQGLVLNTSDGGATWSRPGR